MSLLKFLKNREIGKPYNWKLFETVYPGSDLNDWRRGHKIIKLREQEKECVRCFNKYQVILIKIPDLSDIFEFDIHVFFDFGCMYCDYFLYNK